MIHLKADWEQINLAKCITFRQIRTRICNLNYLVISYSGSYHRSHYEAYNRHWLKEVKALKLLNYDEQSHIGHMHM